MGNFKNIALQELNQFILEHEELTFAETLYAFLRPSILKKDQENLNWLLQVTDKEIYESIEKAKLTEHE